MAPHVSGLHHLRLIRNWAVPSIRPTFSRPQSQPRPPVVSHRLQVTVDQCLAQREAPLPSRAGSSPPMRPSSQFQLLQDGGPTQNYKTTTGFVRSKSTRPLPTVPRIACCGPYPNILSHIWTVMSVLLQIGGDRTFLLDPCVPLSPRPVIERNVIVEPIFSPTNLESPL